MELTAAQARELIKVESTDAIMDKIMTKIRSQAAAGRDFAVLTDNEVPGATKWGKLAREWGGMGNVTEFRTDAQPIVDKLKKLGYKISGAHSEGDGPYPEWWGIEIKW